MIWSRPKWFGHDQNELVWSKLWFSTKMNSFWSWPNHYGQVQINLIWPKQFWTDQNCFGHIKGQGTRNLPLKKPLQSKYSEVLETRQDTSVNRIDLDAIEKEISIDIAELRRDLRHSIYIRTPQVRLNMNEKKPSKSQFNFPTLLGPCSMLKKLSKKIS